MKSFLKVLLAIALAILVIKLLPATLAAGFILAAGVAIFAAVGVSIVALGLYLALAVIALLSPVWLPLLAIVGVVVLIRRSRRTPVLAV